MAVALDVFEVSADEPMFLTDILLPLYVVAAVFLVLWALGTFVYVVASRTWVLATRVQRHLTGHLRSR